jgi:hypothetical protein
MSSGLYRAEVVFDLGRPADGQDWGPAVGEAVKRALSALLDATLVGTSPFGDKAALVSVEVKPVEAAPARKAHNRPPEAEVWEHSSTLEQLPVVVGWAPRQPHGDSSWQLCSSVDRGRGETTFFWRRRLP